MMNCSSTRRVPSIAPAARFATLLLAGSLLAACSAESGLEDDPWGEDSAGVGQTADELAAGPFATWTAWTMPVPVCFKKGANWTAQIDSQYGDLKPLAMAAMQETWALVPGVSFTNQGECTAAHTTSLRIVIAYGPYGGGGCHLGTSPTGRDLSIWGATVDPGAPGSPAATQAVQDVFKQKLTHEIGHALGFDHEHQRVDAFNCNATRVAACERCKADADAGTACTAVDWNTCNPDAPVNTPQNIPADHTDPQYLYLLTFLGDNQTESSFERLTVVDPLSIMNYCGDGIRPSGDYHLTPLDVLGMEMTYPLNVTYPIGCGTGCLRSSSGVITRTDGAVTTSWMARGAHDVRMISPVTGAEVTSMSTAGLPAGTTTLTFPFRAPRATTASLTTSGTLLNSNAHHTALLASL